MNGNWAVANLDTQIPWPTKVTKVRFRSRALFLLPPTSTPMPPGSFASSNETYPCVAARLNPGEHLDQGVQIISHFLSSLSWVERRGSTVEYWSGGNLPRPMGGRSRHPMYSEQFYCPYLPDTQDQKARWALAFYREGLSLNNVAYQCLSFFKVMNIFLPTGGRQKQWMNANAGVVADHQAAMRISDIRAQHQDVGEYLYSSGRCAIAHAGDTPTVDPEDPVDLRRLREDLPVIQALAELAIETVFGIKSRATVYREHLYELEGFHQLIRAPRVERIKTLASIGPGDWPVLPRLTVRLAFHDPYAPLEQMNARLVKINKGVAYVECCSEDEQTRLLLRLNFAQERLQFDTVNDLLSFDDGTEAAIKAAATVARFRFDHFKNGILEIWESDKDRMLGRCDAFLPMNVDMNASIANFKAEIEHLDALAATRADMTPAS